MNDFYCSLTDRFRDFDGLPGFSSDTFSDVTRSAQHRKMKISIQCSCDDVVRTSVHFLLSQFSRFLLFFSMKMSERRGEWRR